MTDHIRAAVSRKKRRFKYDGFNLDLSYIEPNIVAMGYPANKFEGMYRNQLDQVAKFLDQFHKDHYKIYNLCKEKQRNNYPTDKFSGMVCNAYSFGDHEPPPIDKIEPFCQDVHEWLTSHQNNMVAVHCKAGKGRTGVMICCYLLHCGRFSTAEEALDHYAEERTSDGKGVTIPSQRRYVEYYARMKASCSKAENTRLRLRAVTLENLPINSKGSSMVFNVSYGNRKKSVNMGETRNRGSRWHFEIPEPIEVYGDVKVEFYINKIVPVVKEKMFGVCFNTFFIKNDDGADRRGSTGQTGGGNSSWSGCVPGSRPSSTSAPTGGTTITASTPSGACVVSQENGKHQRPCSEPIGEHHAGLPATVIQPAGICSSSSGCVVGNGSGGSSGPEGDAGSVANLDGRYLVLSLNKSQLDKACKNRDFPEAAVIRLTFDSSIEEDPSDSGNGAESVTGSGSGSEERRSEEGSPDEDDSSEEEEDASCVRM